MRSRHVSVGFLAVEPRVVIEVSDTDAFTDVAAKVKGYIGRAVPTPVAIDPTIREVIRPEPHPPISCRTSTRLSMRDVCSMVLRYR